MFLGNVTDRKIAANKTHVSILTSQMLELQKCLQDQVAALTDHTTAQCEQDLTWTRVVAQQGQHLQVGGGSICLA